MEKNLSGLLKITNSVITLITVILLCSISQASYQSSTAVGTEKKHENSKYMLVNSFNYSFSSDAMDSNTQKIFNQGLFYSGTLFILDQYYVSSSLGASFTSIDNNLIEDDNGSFHLSDFSLGLGTRAIKLYKSQTDSVSGFVSLRNVFPLSERSINEGYKSVPSARADVAYQRGFLNLIVSGQQTFVMNSFETNLVGVPNRKSSSVAGFAARLSFKKFRFEYSYRVGVLNYTDGSNVGSSGNNFSMTAIFNKNLWAAMSTSNINYVEDQFVDVWFYDPFQRIYNLSLGVTF